MEKKIYITHLKKYKKELSLNNLNFFPYYYKILLKESYQTLFPFINFIEILIKNKEKFITNWDNKHLISLLKKLLNQIQESNIIIININKNYIEIKDNILKKYYLLEINLNNKSYYYLKKIIKANIIENNNINLNLIYNFIKNIDKEQQVIGIKNKYLKEEMFINSKLNQLKINSTNIRKFITLKDEFAVFANEYLLLKYIDIELLFDEYKNFYEIFFYQETEDKKDFLKTLIQISNLLVKEQFYLKKSWVNQKIIDQLEFFKYKNERIYKIKQSK